MAVGLIVKCPRCKKPYDSGATMAIVHTSKMCTKKRKRKSRRGKERHDGFH